MGVIVVLLIGIAAFQLIQPGEAAPVQVEVATEPGEAEPGETDREVSNPHSSLPSTDVEDPETAASDDERTAGTSAPSAEKQPATVWVHVTGEVHTEGIVEVPTGARVNDALQAAGGTVPAAALDQINLARVVVDGEHIHVPAEGEPLPASAQVGAPGGGAGAVQSGEPGNSSPSQAGLVNINTASATELEALPGVGPALASRIVEHRDLNGPFSSVDDLIMVSGIGPSKLEAIREKATV